MSVERRYFQATSSGEEEIRLERRDDGRLQIVGMAPPWNRWSVDLGGFKERFLPGAFDRWLERSPNDPRGRADVVAKYNHEDSAVLGRTTNGTLSLESTDSGLVYRAVPPEGTPTTAEVVPLIRDKYVTGSSFAFTVADSSGEDWDEDPSGNVKRTITKANLFDVSVVTHPAYPESSVGLRSLEQWRTARGLLQHRDQGRPLVISLDYDQTFTAAPGLWRSFVADAATRGNRVVCITRREDTEENRAEISSSFENMEISGVILCGGSTRKRAAAAAAGIEVDVWIDDSPEMIPVETEARVIPRVSTISGARAAAAAALARLADVRAR
jgi:uncharacterized protein